MYPNYFMYLRPEKVIHDSLFLVFWDLCDHGWHNYKPYCDAVFRS